MNFTKMQGAANDFVLIQTGGRQADWPQLAIAMCDRHRGVGADSLLLLEPSDKAEFGMRTFDADGSEAEICGNGIRCVARYICGKGLVPAATEEITIATTAGVKTVRLGWQDGQLVEIKANMGRPELSADRVPVVPQQGSAEAVDINGMTCCKTKVDDWNLELNCVSMGNPHAVHFIKEPVADFPLDKLGGKVEHLKIFPNRVNFEVARVLGPNKLEARIWERGVGETLACGSGACAIMVASKLRGYTEKDVSIAVPGGTLSVAWNDSGEIILGGPAEFVFEGVWPDEVA